MGEPCLFGFQLAVMRNMTRNIEVTCIYIKSFMSVWLRGCLTYCLMIMLSQIKHSTPSLRKMRSGDVQGKISSPRHIIFIIVSAKTPGNTQTDT